MRFHQKLEAWERPLVLYEIIPPPKSAPREEVADTAAYVRHILADHQIDAINVPDVRNEDRNGSRVAGFLKKLEPRQFALTVSDVFGGEIDLIVNHGCVHEPSDKQDAWFETTFTKFAIPNVVIVGGESSAIDYPGPSVTEAVGIATKVAERTGTEAGLGAITIPGRRGGSLDEPDRMVEKVRAGVSFFTSQVIFEPEHSRALVADYAAACHEAGLTPAPIFLSFAPITGRKDAEFLEWLGVEIPPSAKEWMLAVHGSALERSARVAEHVLRDVLTYADRRGLDVPIGINVEHIMRYNFEASEVLLERLTSLLEWRELERHPPSRGEP